VGPCHGNEEIADDPAVGVIERTIRDVARRGSKGETAVLQPEMV